MTHLQVKIRDKRRIIGQDILKLKNRIETSRILHKSDFLKKVIKQE